MKYAAINAGNAGDNTIIAAVPNKRIRILGYTVIASGIVTMTWKSGSTSISGPMAMAANGGAAPATTALTPAGLVGVLEGGIGEAIIINLGGAVTVGGHLVYIEVVT